MKSKASQVRALASERNATHSRIMHEAALDGWRNSGPPVITASERIALKPFALRYRAFALHILLPIARQNGLVK